MSPNPTPIMSDLDRALIGIGITLDYQLDLFDEVKPELGEHRDVAMLPTTDIDVNDLDWTTVFAEVFRNMASNVPMNTVSLNVLRLTPEVQDECYVLFRDNAIAKHGFGWMNLLVDACQPLTAGQLVTSYIKSGSTEEQKREALRQLTAIKDELATIVGRTI